MEHRLHTLTTVLGHPRVLREAAADPRRRVLDGVNADIAGVAAWEPLFGRQGEGVIALRDAARPGRVATLLHALLEQATADGLVLVHFVIDPDQHPLAATLAAETPGATLGERLSVRLEPKQE